MTSTITFHANDWRASDIKIGDSTDQDDRDDRALSLVIRAFGRTRDGRSVCISIKGFRPYFFVRASQSTRDIVKRALSDDYSQKHTRVTRTEAKDMWGFCNGETTTFFKMTFASQWSMRKMNRTMEDNRIRTYESNVEPVLRYMHVADIEPCGWLTASQCIPNLSSMPSTCDLDFCVSHENVTVARDDVTVAPPLVIASFDIECASVDVGQFPTPRKTYRHMASKLVEMFGRIAPQECKDEKFIARRIKQMIVDALRAEKDARLPGKDHDVTFVNRMPRVHELPFIVIDTKHKRSDRWNFDAIAQGAADGCAPYIMALKEGREKECDVIPLLETQLQRTMPPQQGDPIIMIGTTVHVNGENECSQKHVMSLGQSTYESESALLLGWADFIADMKPDVLTGYNIFGFDWSFIHIRCEELGIADEFGLRLGRVPGEACKFVRKELSSSALGENVLEFYDIPGTVSIDMMKIVQRDHKLPSYSLNEVSKHFLKQQKKDVKPSEIVSMFCDPETRCRVEEYCVQDCALCNTLAIKLQTVPNGQGMANVCTVPLQYIVLRGQGIKIFSLVVRYAGKRGYVIPCLKGRSAECDDQNNNNDDERETTGYEGAMVLEPKKGVYKIPIVVCDYSSLYPSCMMAENLSHDTIVLDPKYDNLPGVEYNEVRYTQSDPTLPEKVCRFSCSHVGILPTILQELVSQRKKTRAMIKDTSDPFQKAVLDGLQLAYKVTANSLYGQMGAVTSPLYMKDIAACTTASGRTMLAKAKKFMEDQYGADVIYGDSDSIFCAFPGVKDVSDKKDALRIAIDTAVEAVERFKSEIKHPHELTYEKTMMPFILLGKKKYTGVLYEHDVDEGHVKSMGIVLRRRDNANILKLVYGGMIEILLRDMDANKAVIFLDESLQRLVDNEYPQEDLVITKALRSNYKNPASIAHKVLADRMAARDPGNAPAIGERIPYAYIETTSKGHVLQGDKIEHPDYIRDNPRTVKIDVRFYITNQLAKPISQLMSLVVDDVEKSLRPHTRKRLPSEWKQELAKLEKLFPGNRSKVQEHYDRMRERFTESYLFGDILAKLDNKKSGQRRITDMFPRTVESV